MNKNIKLIKNIKDEEFYKEIYHIRVSSQCIGDSQDCIDIIDTINFIDDCFETIPELEGMDEMMQYGLTMVALKKPPY